MELHSTEPCFGRQRADKLGLSSSRFVLKQMGQNANQAINNVKKKDRPQLKLQQWQKKQYYRLDATRQLFNCPDQVNREYMNKLSVEQFVQKYEKKNLPVVIDGCTQKWETQKYWTFQHFYQNYKNLKFKVGEDDDGYKLKIPFKYFLQYMVYNTDDSPLYLFQSSLEDNKDLQPIIGRYQVPPYFRDDILKFAGQKNRPPYRWLLMGPERSGSTIHIDPLDTSAWNTSLVGHKRWILFPNNIPKFIVKGKVFRNKDYQDEAINYFVHILPKIIESQGRKNLGVIQFIQHPGETVFVPGGWWHAVLNLDDTMAVTQNVMTHTNFQKVWRSMRSQRKKFAQKFLSLLQKQENSLYMRAIKVNEQDDYEMGSKYQKQEVSISFTPSSSSSSSSSSQQFSSRSKDRSSKRSKSELSRAYSRSRQKPKKQRSFSQTKNGTKI